MVRQKPIPLRTTGWISYLPMTQKNFPLVKRSQISKCLPSMKMEIAAEATDAGRVTKVHVSEGQPVDEGATLVTVG